MFPINSHRDRKQFFSWKSTCNQFALQISASDSDAISLEIADDTALNGCIGRNDDKKIGDGDNDGDSDTVFDTVVFTWNLLKSINLFNFDIVCLLIERYTFKCHNSGAS